MKKLLSILLLCFCFSATAQNIFQRKSTIIDSIHNSQRKPSVHREYLIEEEIVFRKYLDETKTKKSTSYVIPVVVHIIKNEFDENWVDMDITDADVYRQIEILNHKCHIFLL